MYIHVCVHLYMYFRKFVGNEKVILVQFLKIHGYEEFSKKFMKNVYYGNTTGGFKKFLYPNKLIFEFHFFHELFGETLHMYLCLLNTYISAQICTHMWLSVTIMLVLK